MSFDSSLYMARSPWSGAHSAASCLCDERRSDEVLRDRESGIVRCSVRDLSLVNDTLVLLAIMVGFVMNICRKFPSANKSSLRRVVMRYNSVRKFPTYTGRL